VTYYKLSEVLINKENQLNQFNLLLILKKGFFSK